MLRHILLLIFLIALCTYAQSQNVGINTLNPSKMLSVAGSIALDHENTNSGTLDSAALLFGTNPASVGIFSRKTPGTGSAFGLEFWTDNQRRMFISEQGTVGIGLTNHDPNFDLHVGGSIKTYTLQALTANITGDAHITQEANVGDRVNINGNEYTSLYRLTVNDGDSYFDGNGVFTNKLFVQDDLDVDGGIVSSLDIACFGQMRAPTIRAVDNMSVGGMVDPAYRLRVYDGSTRLGGDVQILGVLNAQDINCDDLELDKINGKGVVKSNGNSSLRIGFDYVWLNHILNGGFQADVTANITDFSGGDNDVRVSVSQFDPDPLPQFVNWHDCTFHVHSVDPVTDTCKIRITNTTGANIQIKGMLYLTSIAKD